MSKADNLEHNVLIVEAELLLEMNFTMNVKVGATTADASFVHDAIRYFVEIDNETMSPQQMREKWLKYQAFDGVILLICHTKNRLRRLLKSAERVKEQLLFTRFERLQSTRIREPWLDWHFKRLSIRRELSRQA